jgi:ABC-2 type transport system permease protein
VSALLPATRAELTKIFTLRSAWLVTGAILGLQFLVEAQALGLTADAVAGIAPDGTIEIFTGLREPADRAILDLLAGSSLQMSIFLPGLAAVIAGQEFRGRQLGASVLAVPRRGLLLAAKTLAAGAYLALTAVLIAGTSMAFSYLAVKTWNPGLLLTAEALTGRARFIGYALLLGLVTCAIAVIARGTLVAILASLALTTVTMTQMLAGTPGLDALFPVSAGRNLLLDPATGDLTASPGHAALVLVGWALLTTLIAGITLARRDAR